MNPKTRNAALGAVFIISLSAVAQFLAWWLVLDKDTFGPRGDGAKLIADAFGVVPALVALWLEHAVRAGVLLAVGVLAVGLFSSDPPHRNYRRVYRRRTAADDEDDEDE
jgi:hypothetical protein